MNYERLKQDIYEEDAAQTLAIREESDIDILVDDFENDKHINFHIVPPTEVWLAERFVWGPSFGEKTADWTAYLSQYLMRIDPAMLVCLNHIIIIDGDQDVEPVVETLDTEDDFPNMDGEILGCLWYYENNVVIDVAAIRDASRQLVSGDPGAFALEDEMESGFLVTLLHVIRRLGLVCNIFLPEDEYPLPLQSNEAIEEWARDTYECI